MRGERAGKLQFHDIPRPDHALPPLLASFLLTASSSLSPAQAPTEFEAVVLKHALASEVASEITALISNHAE